MSAERYTLVLTQGVHTIAVDSYEAIRAAIAAGEKFVEVELDFFGNPAYATMTTIVTAHIVLMAESNRLGEREVSRSTDRRLQLLR